MKNRIITILALGVIVFSCDTKKKTNKSDKKPVQTEVKSEAKKVVVAKTESSNEVVELVINSTDQMQFDKSELKVSAGKKVRLTLNHTGKMKKVVMGHNWVLLQKGTNIAEFTQLAMKSKDTDYIPVSDAIIASTKTIGGGESSTVEFEAPAAGEYDFICSFPGHCAIMKGKLIVD